MSETVPVVPANPDAVTVPEWRVELIQTIFLECGGVRREHITCQAFTSADPQPPAAIEAGHLVVRIPLPDQVACAGSPPTANGVPRIAPS